VNLPGYFECGVNLIDLGLFVACFTEAKMLGINHPGFFVPFSNSNLTSYLCCHIMPVASLRLPFIVNSKAQRTEISPTL
jgi:hypothetical protein